MYTTTEELLTATGEETVTIDWERGSYIDSEDHTLMYEALGESADGRKWIGTMRITCDEIDGVEFIDEE